MHKKRIKIKSDKIKLKKILNNLGLIFIICLILFILYSKFFSQKSIINPFGIQILIVESNSMFPEFEKGNIIIIKEEKEYNIGDIITFLDDTGTLVTHRIIEKYEDGFFTKGDNNNTRDKEKVTIPKISGKVIYVFK